MINTYFANIATIKLLTVSNQHLYISDITRRVCACAITGIAGVAIYLLDRAKYTDGNYHKYVKHYLDHKNMIV